MVAHRGDLLGRDVLDVRLAARRLGDLGRVDVEAEHGEAMGAEDPGEREADVAEADDADFGLALLDARQQLGVHVRMRLHGPLPSELANQGACASGCVGWRFRRRGRWSATALWNRPCPNASS